MNRDRSDLSVIRKWDMWEDASDEEKKKMIELLKDGRGFI